MTVGLKEATRNIPNWAIDFVMNEPWFGSSRSHSYAEEFYLDLEDIQRRSEIERDIPDKAEFAKMVKGKTPVEQEEIANSIHARLIENRQNERCRNVISKMIEDPLGTLDFLNGALRLLVVKVADEDEPDFRMPEFKVINASIFQAKVQDLILEEDEGRLVEVRGWLRYVKDSPVERVVYATWECAKCGQDQPSHAPIPPTWCGECQKKAPMTAVEERRQKYQEAGISENYEDAKGVPTPLTVEFTGGYVNAFSPGDRLIVVGILEGRVIPKKGGNEEAREYRHLLKVLSARKEDEVKLDITASDVQEIEQFAQQPRPLERLADSFAPEIVGNHMIKIALILQAAGGVEERHGNRRIRGRIHTLLCGDPGLGKSQMLRAIMMQIDGVEPVNTGSRFLRYTYRKKGD